MNHTQTMSSQTNSCSYYNVFKTNQLYINELLIMSYKIITLHDALSRLSNKK